MEKSLVIYENNQQIEISAEDIRKYIAPDLTEKEFWMFMQTAKTFGLNPLKREIYAVKYGDRFSIITGYQVYLRRIIEADILEYWDVDVIKEDPKNLDTWIGVFTAKRKDWAKEFVWKVSMKEVNKKQALWNIQPEFQLKKTTISQGCRMLAPDIVGGIPYTNEEIGVEEESQFESRSTQRQNLNPNLRETPEDEQSEDVIAEKAKIEYLTKLSDTIGKFTTIAKIDEFYNKNSKIYKTSAFLDDIKALYIERKNELANGIMSKNMSVDVQDLIDFRKEMNGHGLDMTLIQQVLDGTKEAVSELKKRIENWKKDRDAKRDAEAKAQSEETEPDAVQESATQSELEM